jgi:hypothetical protein
MRTVPKEINRRLRKREQRAMKLRAAQKISVFQCFCGHEKAGNQATLQEILISTITISLELWHLLNRSHATIAI